MAEQLKQAGERQAALVKLAAGGLAAALQQAPRLEDYNWCYLHSASSGLLSLAPLYEGVRAHEQQSGGSLLRLALQSQEPLAAELAGLSILPSSAPAHATVAAGVPFSNLALAAVALQATAQSVDPWAQLGPILPQLFSFLRGVHVTFRLATAAVPAGAEGAHLSAQLRTDSPPATADSSSVAARMWSDTALFFNMYRASYMLALAFRNLATGPLPSVHSGTLAVAADCVDALLRLAPLLPRLPRAASPIAGNPSRELPAVRLQPAGSLPLVEAHGFWRLCEVSPPQGLAIASAELAHSLAATLSCALEVAAGQEPAAVGDVALPALRACWTALKYEAAQAATEDAACAAEEAAASGAVQARRRCIVVGAVWCGLTVWLLFSHITGCCVAVVFGFANVLCLLYGSHAWLPSAACIPWLCRLTAHSQCFQ